MGLDGSRWVFEARGAGPGRYHLVDRWQPDHGDPFRRLCLRLAELGGVAGEVVSYG